MGETNNTVGQVYNVDVTCPIDSPILCNIRRASGDDMDTRDEKLVKFAQEIEASMELDPGQLGNLDALTYSSVGPNKNDDDFITSLQQIIQEHKSKRDPVAFETEFMGKWYRMTEYYNDSFNQGNRPSRKISIDFEDVEITGNQKKDLYVFVGEWLKDNDTKQSDGICYYEATDDDIVDLPITINFEESQLCINEQRALTVAVGHWLKDRNLL